MGRKDFNGREPLGKGEKCERKRESMHCWQGSICEQFASPSKLAVYPNSSDMNKLAEITGDAKCFRR